MIAAYVIYAIKGTLRVLSSVLNVTIIRVKNISKQFVIISLKVMVFYIRVKL